MAHEEVKFDRSKLKGKIIEVYRTQENFQKAMGISHTSLTKRLKGDSGFTQDEIIKASKLLGIGDDEISPYFFALKV